MSLWVLSNSKWSRGRGIRRHAPVFLLDVSGKFFLTLICALSGGVVRDANLDRSVSAMLFISCKPDRGVRSVPKLFDDRATFPELIVQLNWVISAGSISTSLFGVADLLIKWPIGCILFVLLLDLPATCSW